MVRKKIDRKRYNYYQGLMQRAAFQATKYFKRKYPEEYWRVYRRYKAYFKSITPKPVFLGKYPGLHQQILNKQKENIIENKDGISNSN